MKFSQLPTIKLNELNIQSVGPINYILDEESGCPVLMQQLLIADMKQNPVCLQAINLAVPFMDLKRAGCLPCFRVEDSIPPSENSNKE